MLTQSALAEAVLIHRGGARSPESGLNDPLIHVLAGNRPAPTGLCDATELATPHWGLGAVLRERARRFLQPLRWVPVKTSVTRPTGG